MGSDIHIYLEKRIGGVWHSAEPIVTIDPEENIKDVPFQFRTWTKRDYYLFSILAGVRATFNFEQKFERKGFPEDASPNIKKMYSRYESDAHSASYLTLKDLKSINWDEEYAVIYYSVTKRQQELYKRWVKYKNDNRGHFEQGRWVSEDKNPLLLDDLIYSDIAHPWSSPLEDFLGMETNKEELKNVPFVVPIREVVNEFYERVVQDKMERFEPAIAPEDIRIVFWFDN